MTDYNFNGSDISGERLLNQAMKVALDQDSPEQMIFQFFSVIGHFFQCDRVFLYENHGIADETYVVEWQNENIPSHKYFLESLGTEELDYINGLFARDNFIYINDVDSIKDVHSSFYEILSSQNISTVFLHPLIVKNELIGFYGFENFSNIDLVSIYDFIEMFGNFLISLLKFKTTILQLQNLSEHDSMTGLYNRGRGESKIAGMVNNGMEGMFLMMDGNHFKSINDTYGHAVGDKVILAFAKVLHTVFDSIGIPMRLGGDEFAVFVPAFTSQKDAVFLLKDLENAIAEIDIPEMNGAKISASIGVAFKNVDDNISFEELYKHADDSVYISKKTPGTPLTYYKD